MSSMNIGVSELMDRWRHENSNYSEHAAKVPETRARRNFREPRLNQARTSEGRIADTGANRGSSPSPHPTDQWPLLATANRLLSPCSVSTEVL
jgi:hypothetical protein